MLGDRLTRAGYEPGGAVRPAPGELLHYRRVSALRRAAHARRRLRDRRTRLRERGPVAELPTAT